MPKKITEDGEVLDVVTHEVVARAPIYWKTPNNHDTDVEAAYTALGTFDESKTQQQFAKDADINVILAKFLQTGELPQTAAPIYQDIDEEFDLQSKMVTAYEVQQAWDALPAKVRNTLRDPKTFADYVTHCMQTGDLDELRELGLAKPLPPQETSPEPKTATGGAPAPAAAKEPATGS